MLGGGPGGAATAIALRRRGYSVAIVEKSDYTNLRIGETFPPDIRKLLVSLGVWEKFLADKHSPSFGIQSAWGQPELYDNDFIFNPYGTGWHVDRPRFDAMLAHHAEAAEVKVYRRARLMSCAQTVPGDWKIDIGSDDQARVRRGSLRTRFVVDATGRASTFARKQGARRITYDQLVGIVSFFESTEVERDLRARLTQASDKPKRARRSRSTTATHHTLVEAVEDGWWYSATLPDARVVTVFMTDADLYARASKRFANYWRQQLRNASHTHARTKGHALKPDHVIVAANTSRLDRVAGKNWLAVGDAAMSLDPLSSLGVYHALQSGLRAAQAIDACWKGDAAALQIYNVSVAEHYDACLKTRAKYYAVETRWPGSPFWQRRQVKKF